MSKIAELEANNVDPDQTPFFFQRLILVYVVDQACLSHYLDSTDSRRSAVIFWAQLFKTNNVVKILI